jgi:hypothetical protein
VVGPVGQQQVHEVAIEMSVPAPGSTGHRHGCDHVDGIEVLGQADEVA